MQWGSGGRLVGGRAWLSSHMGGREREKRRSKEAAATKKLRESEQGFSES